MTKIYLDNVKDEPPTTIEQKGYYALKQQARLNVLKVRGSDDVPAFDLCVKAEIERLKNKEDV